MDVGNKIDMRELTKSVITLPWAISMFGVQQIANLVAPPSTGRMAGASKAFDAVSDATSQQLEGWLKQTYQIGTGVQRALVDLLMLRPPDIDSSALMRMAAEMQSAPMFQAVVKYGMPPVGWVDSLFVSRQDAPAVAQEFANKLHIITLVTQVHSQLGLHGDQVDPLPTLVEKAAVLETFPRLWAVEGLGNYVGDHALANAGAAPVTGLLNGPSTATLPPWTMTMLHAGIGMSFAKHILKRLTPASSPEAVRDGIAEFVTLCRDSSRRGYTGAALESLGLATRTLYPNLLRLIDQNIPADGSELQAYFWHGAGRAMYFEPMNMLPSVNAPWRVMRRLDQEAPHDVARRNLLSGIAWALTVVNMRHPVVMEAFLRHHAGEVGQDDAFTDGVTSSMMMRYDTTREDASIRPFIHHEPSAADGNLAALWRDLITVPCQTALQMQYPVLAEQQKLEHLFHYGSSH